MTQVVSHHQGVVIKVPGLGSECVCVRVHDGVLQDINCAGHVVGKDALRPSWEVVGFCEQST